MVELICIRNESGVGSRTLTPWMSSVAALTLDWAMLGTPTKMLRNANRQMCPCFKVVVVRGPSSRDPCGTGPHRIRAFPSFHFFALGRGRGRFGPAGTLPFAWLARANGQMELTSQQQKQSVRATVAHTRRGRGWGLGVGALDKGPAQRQGPAMLADKRATCAHSQQPLAWSLWRCLGDGGRSEGRGERAERGRGAGRDLHETDDEDDDAGKDDEMEPPEALAVVDAGASLARLDGRAGAIFRLRDLVLGVGHGGLLLLRRRLLLRLRLSCECEMRWTGRGGG